MTLVVLENCKNCRFLPALGQLPSLKKLSIKGMSGVESVGPEFYGKAEGLPFPVLETLEFMDMEEWKEWLPWEHGQGNGVFPCLRMLSISTCPKLKGILPKNMNSISKLVVDGCEQLIVSIASYKPICELNICGCKEVLDGSGVKFELLEAMELSSISEFRLGIEGFLRGLRKLKYLKITGCEELTFLRQNGNRWLQPWIGNSESHFVQKLMSLQQRLVIGCSNLISFPQNDNRRMQPGIGSSQFHFVQELVSLQRLHIIGCSNLISFPEVGLPPFLKHLKIESCNSLAYFTRYHIPLSLRRIEIGDCLNLKSLVEGEGSSSSFSSGLMHEEESCLEYLKIWSVHL